MDQADTTNFVAETPKEVQMEAIASALVAGMDFQHMCNWFNYTPGGLRNLLKNDKMISLVGQKKALVAAKMVNAATKLVDNLEQSADNLVDMANNLTHKDSYKANERILDSIMPRPVERKEVALVMEGSAEAMTTFTEGMKELKELFDRDNSKIEDSPHLIDGVDSADSLIEAEFVVEEKEEDGS